jgi:hypothetical protein
LVKPLNPSPFFTSGCQHFDSLKKGELEKLHQLFTRDDHCTAMLKKEPLDEEEDAVGGCIEKFDRLDISGGIDDIANEDLFDEEVVDEGNIFN